MKKLNSKGFSVVEGILLVVIVGLIAGVGYYVWKQQRDVNKTLDNAQGNLQNLAEQNNEETTEEVAEKIEVPTESENEAETPVEESTTTTWVVNGVSFELENSVGNLLTYKLRGDTTNLSTSTIVAKEKKEYGKNEVCMAQDFPVGRISVRKESVSFDGYELVKKFNASTYLYYVDDGPSSFCHIERPKVWSLQKEQIKQLKAALKNAQLAE